MDDDTASFIFKDCLIAEVFQDSSESPPPLPCLNNNILDMMSGSSSVVTDLFDLNDSKPIFDGSIDFSMETKSHNEHDDNSMIDNGLELGSSSPFYVIGDSGDQEKFQHGLVVGSNMVISSADELDQSYTSNEHQQNSPIKFDHDFDEQSGNNFRTEQKNSSPPSFLVTDSSNDSSSFFTYTIRANEPQIITTNITTSSNPMKYFHNATSFGDFLPASRIKSKMHDLALRHRLITSQNLKSCGQLYLSVEEKKTLIQEGYSIPTTLPLTKKEEEALKFVRRKIKNKLSAQESRRRRKEYIDTLEKKLDDFQRENDQLRDRLDSLEMNNRSLSNQLRKVQSIVGPSSSPDSKNPNSPNQRSSPAHSTATGVTLTAFFLLFAILLPSWPVWTWVKLIPNGLNVDNGSGRYFLDQKPTDQQIPAMSLFNHNQIESENRDMVGETGRILVPDFAADSAPLCPSVSDFFERYNHQKDQKSCPITNIEDKSIDEWSITGPQSEYSTTNDIYCYSNHCKAEIVAHA